MPSVSYIVSAFERPDCLPCCLWSLKIQTDPDFEVIVADNALDWRVQLQHQRAVEALGDSRFRHCNTAKQSTDQAWDSYWSAEWAVKHETRGAWICLPSDDSYYVPVFQQVMLTKARLDKLQLVYCDMLYDRRLAGKYKVLNTAPAPEFIDKTGFLVARDAWIGFPTKRQRWPGPSICDGQMIQELVRRGVPHGKVDEVLCVHN
jgi:hypothetical protein